MTDQNRADEALDNQKIKDEWIAALIDLMSQIRGWVTGQEKYIVGVIEGTVEQSEEYLGKYFAPMLVLAMESGHVQVLPAGRFGIGAIGRVDLTNGRRSFALLFSRRKGWASLETRKPLTGELFLKLLEQLSQHNSEEPQWEN